MHPRGIPRRQDHLAYKNEKEAYLLPTMWKQARDQQWAYGPRDTQRTHRDEADHTENGCANIILTEGNFREVEEGKPDGQTSRVINPRGIAPCLTTNGSVYVDVRELECGETKEIVQPENKPKKKPGRKGVPVLQFNLDGEWIKEWESSSMAETSLKMSHQSIGKAARGMNNHKACGFLWYKKDDPEVIINNAA